MKNVQIHPTSIIETETIGENTKIWAFSHICKGVIIGENCVIGEGVYIGPNVVIGNNVKIQNNSLIYEGVTIEDNVEIDAGSVVNKNINSGSLHGGIPAKQIKILN